jgi:hypothetical protein
MASLVGKKFLQDMTLFDGISRYCRQEQLRAALATSETPNPNRRLQMTQIRTLSRIKYLALALLATCLSAGVASAQQYPAVYHGKFILPFEAQWGSVSLPAGEYTFTLDSTTLPAFVTVRGDSRGSQPLKIMAQAISQQSSSYQSALVVVRSSGRGVVRNLHLAELGMDFEYAMPKGATLVAQGPRLVQRIPVSAGGR